MQLALLFDYIGPKYVWLSSMCVIMWIASVLPLWVDAIVHVALWLWPRLLGASASQATIVPPDWRDATQRVCTDPLRPGGSEEVGLCNILIRLVQRADRAHSEALAMLIFAYFRALQLGMLAAHLAYISSVNNWLGAPFAAVMLCGLLVLDIARHRVAYRIGRELYQFAPPLQQQPQETADGSLGRFSHLRQGGAHRLGETIVPEPFAQHVTRNPPKKHATLARINPLLDDTQTPWWRVLLVDIRTEALQRQNRGAMRAIPILKSLSLAPLSSSSSSSFSSSSSSSFSSLRHPYSTQGMLDIKDQERVWPNAECGVSTPAPLSSRKNLDRTGPRNNSYALEEARSASISESEAGPAADSVALGPGSVQVECAGPQTLQVALRGHVPPPATHVHMFEFLDAAGRSALARTSRALHECETSSGCAPQYVVRCSSTARLRWHDRIHSHTSQLHLSGTPSAQLLRHLSERLGHLSTLVLTVRARDPPLTDLKALRPLRGMLRILELHQLSSYALLAVDVGNDLTDMLTQFCLVLPNDSMRALDACATGMATLIRFRLRINPSVETRQEHQMLQPSTTLASALRFVRRCRIARLAHLSETRAASLGVTYSAMSTSQTQHCLQAAGSSASIKSLSRFTSAESFERANPLRGESLMAVEFLCPQLRLSCDDFARSVRMELQKANVERFWVGLHTPTALRALMSCIRKSVTDLDISGSDFRVRRLEDNWTFPLSVVWATAAEPQNLVPVPLHGAVVLNTAEEEEEEEENGLENSEHDSGERKVARDSDGDGTGGSADFLEVRFLAPHLRSLRATQCIRMNEYAIEHLCKMLRAPLLQEVDLAWPLVSAPKDTRHSRFGFHGADEDDDTLDADGDGGSGGSFSKRNNLPDPQDLRVIARHWPTLKALSLDGWHLEPGSRLPMLCDLDTLDVRSNSTPSIAWALRAYPRLTVLRASQSSDQETLPDDLRGHPLRELDLWSAPVSAALLQSCANAAFARLEEKQPLNLCSILLPKSCNLGTHIESALAVTALERAGVLCLDQTAELNRACSIFRIPPVRPDLAHA